MEDLALQVIEHEQLDTVSGAGLTFFGGADITPVPMPAPIEPIPFAPGE